ncbi:hypothetical protein BBJ28_00001491 [Nothophytophthora sp. Chile5]|nr:hypothetical protein BBJ28_00001491 [Nothophytophthora sp. Chile5]
MGIDGFLRQLREVVDDTHLRQFAGQTLVVDALSWLHKACYGCAFDLSTGRETDAYVRYMLRKVDMMRGCGVGKVILVFDGQRLPLKVRDVFASTHEKRQSYKEDNRKRALQAMAASKRLQGTDRQAELNQAYQHFQREIIATVMAALRVANVPFVVAPFEADAQMVWMCKEGLAAGIVTEDSDVVVYCVTAKVSTPVLTAVKHIFNYRGAPSHLRVPRLVSKLSSSGTNIPPDFIQRFAKAETIFFHHLVFNPTRRSCEFLIGAGHDNCFPDILQRARESLGLAASTDGSELDLRAQDENLHAGATLATSFLGEVRSRELVEQIYKGDVCARTFRKLSDGATLHQSQSPQTTGFPVRRGEISDNDASFAEDANGSGESSEAYPDPMQEFEEGGFPTQIARRTANSTPVTTLSARQIELKQRSQAHQREASLRNLISAYPTKVPADLPTPPSNVSLHPHVSTVSADAVGKKRSVESVFGRETSTAPTDDENAD